MYNFKNGQAQPSKLDTVPKLRSLELQARQLFFVVKYDRLRIQATLFYLFVVTEQNCIFLAIIYL